MTKKIVIWGAWYGSKNVGDQLLLLAITDMIHSCLVEDVEFSVLTDNASWIKEYTSVESECDITAIQSRNQLSAVIRSIKDCDLFILGGGVPIFEQTSHVVIFLFLISLVRFFNKQYLFWSVSSQQIKSKIALLSYKWIFLGAAGLTCRDPNTKKLIESFGIDPNNIHLSADPGFNLKFDNADGKKIIRKYLKSSNKRPLVALTPRKLRSFEKEAETHYTLRSPELYQQEIDCFVAAHDWLWENGYQPIFIPMNTVAPDDDREAAIDIRAKAKYGQHSIIVEDALRPREVPGIYQQCYVSFVARVHGSITSYLGGCPVMMFAFAPKHEGIMELMELDDYCLKEDNFTPEETIAVLKKIIKNREELHEKATSHLHILKKNAQIPADLTIQLLNRTDKPKNNASVENHKIK